MTNEFKGTINGIDFYNVKEYNEYLTELIKKGVNINAQSNTNITNVSDEGENSGCCCGGGCCCGNGECKDKLIVRLGTCVSVIPSRIYILGVSLITWRSSGGYVPFFEEGDEYYLDNEKLDVDTAAKVFDEFVKTLDNKLDNLCSCQLNDYLNTVSDIRGSITSDDSFAESKCDEYEKLIKKYTEGISKIQEELEKVRNKQRCMKEFAKKIDVFDQFYKYLEGEISKEIEIKELKKKIEKKLETKLENTPKKVAPDERIHSLNECLKQSPDNTATAKIKDPDIFDGYRRLLKAIFDED